MVRCEGIAAESKMAQILSLGNQGMMMLYIETAEVLIWGVDDECNFGHDGICGMAGHSGKLFSGQLEIVNYISE